MALNGLVCAVVPLKNYSLARSLARSVTHSLTHSLARSLARSLTHSLMPYFTDHNVDCSVTVEMHLSVCCVLCSGFPCEDPPTPAAWSTNESTTANVSTPCSCVTGFQQCPAGTYYFFHVLAFVSVRLVICCKCSSNIDIGMCCKSHCDGIDFGIIIHRNLTCCRNKCGHLTLLLNLYVLPILISDYIASVSWDTTTL